MGMALLTFTWTLFSFVFFMKNNQIRAVMASRHAAWMVGNGQQPTGDDLAAKFGFDSAAPVTLNPAPQQVSLSFGGSSTFSSINGNNSAYVVTVTYGMTASDITATSPYPFSLMNSSIQVPLMGPTMLSNATLVHAQCAWPANVNNQWQSASDAFNGVIGTIESEVGGFMGEILSLM
jgi:hypothetical protein